jgi:hypothetical protein
LFVHKGAVGRRAAEGTGENFNLNLTFPMFLYSQKTFINSTCEVWDSDDQRWDTSICLQNNIEIRNGLVTCTCYPEDTVLLITSNVLDEKNVGDQIITMPVRVEDPFELNEKNTDDDGYMFFMNPIWVLIILCNLHTNSVLLAHVKDRESGAKV